MAEARPCARCKQVRRKCNQHCEYAQFFPQNQPEKYNLVHQMFGGTNALNMAIQKPAEQRNVFVDSLHQDAIIWENHPIHGPPGIIAELQNEHQVKDNIIAELQKEHQVKDNIIADSNIQIQILNDTVNTLRAEIERGPSKRQKTVNTDVPANLASSRDLRLRDDDLSLRLSLQPTSSASTLPCVNEPEAEHQHGSTRAPEHPSTSTAAAEHPSTSTAAAEHQRASTDEAEHSSST